MNVIRHELDIIDENCAFKDREIFILHGRMVGALYKALRCHQRIQELESGLTLTYQDMRSCTIMYEMKQKLMNFAAVLQTTMFGGNAFGLPERDVRWEYNFSQKDIDLLKGMD